MHSRCALTFLGAFSSCRESRWTPSPSRSGRCAFCCHRVRSLSLVLLLRGKSRPGASFAFLPRGVPRVLFMGFSASSADACAWLLLQHPHSSSCGPLRVSLASFSACGVHDLWTLLSRPCINPRPFVVSFSGLYCLCGFMRHSLHVHAMTDNTVKHASDCATGSWRLRQLPEEAGRRGRCSAPAPLSCSIREGNVACSFFLF